MSCCLKINDFNNTERDILIVVAKCSSVERRWEECKYLSQIAFYKESKLMFGD